MKRDFIHLLLSILPINVRYEIYANWRSGVIKNGGCSVYLLGRRVAYLYAIVDTCGSIVEVVREGIFASSFKGEMENNLMEYLSQQEESCENPRDLYFNYIDTPLR